MRKCNSTQNTKEFRFSSDAVEAKKVFQFEEVNNPNPDADRVPHTHWDEPPVASVFTKMVPCPPCIWG